MYVPPCVRAIQGKVMTIKLGEDINDLVWNKLVLEQEYVYSASVPNMFSLLFHDLAGLIHRKLQNEMLNSLVWDSTVVYTSTGFSMSIRL